MGANATAIQKSSETMSNDAATMMPEISTVSESVKTAATGCPVGSDQEDWCRAAAMLKNALVAKCEDLSGRPSIPRCETRTESETLAKPCGVWHNGRPVDLRSAI